MIHNLIGLSEIQTGVYWFADMAEIDKYSEFSYNSIARTPVSMFTNTNNFATVITLGIFITYIVIVNTNSQILKSIGVLSVIISIYLLVRTNSRANMLGLVIGLLVFIYMKYYCKRMNKKSLLILLFLPLIFFNPYVLNKIVTFVFSKLVFNFSGTESDGIRVGLIRNGLLFLKKTNAFGVGAGNIEYWMENYKVFYTDKITNMHNWWMEILVGYGIIIFISYIWTYLKMYKLFYKSYIGSEDKFIKSTTLALISLMSAFIICSISSSSNVGSSWMWALWGTIIAFVKYVEKNSRIGYAN
ncbi:hypothetical protein MASR2M29_03720 [Spirochaetota bacterium]